MVGAFDLEVTVYDKNDAFAQTTIEGCGINLISVMDDCDQFGSLLTNIQTRFDNYLSTHLKNNYLFQILQALMEHFSENIDLYKDYDCTYQILIRIWDMVVYNFGSQQVTFCESGYSLVCEEVLILHWVFSLPNLVCLFLLCILNSNWHN